MCGRINLRTNLHDVGNLFHVISGLQSVESLPMRYNTPPTAMMVCIRDAGEREFFPAKWGLIPSWEKDAKIGASCSNARVETVDTKPAFRTAFKRRRCLVIAAGFYEWHTVGKTKTPFYITLGSKEPMPFAGLWETWDGPDGKLESCTICTTTANDFMGKIHHRMPIILPHDSIDLWLDPEVTYPERIKPLLRQYPDELMVSWQVDQRVGNVRNEGADLIAPVAAPTVIQLESPQ